MCKLPLYTEGFLCSSNHLARECAFNRLQVLILLPSSILFDFSVGKRAVANYDGRTDVG